LLRYHVNCSEAELAGERRCAQPLCCTASSNGSPGTGLTHHSWISDASERVAQQASSESRPLEVRVCGTQSDRYLQRSTRRPERTTISAVVGKRARLDPGHPGQRWCRHGHVRKRRERRGGPTPPFAVTGTVTEDLLVFTVNWGGLITTWCGHHVDADGSAQILTLWYLVKAVPDETNPANQWKMIEAGADSFMRA
jgi:Avidin family